MRKTLIAAVIGGAMMMAGPSANAQVNLSAYADPEGFLDVQALTCAQLAGTWQDQADLLASWYSGWYNGLAKRHYMDIKKGREAEHELIVYCKANPQLKIIQAIDVVFKEHAGTDGHQGAVRMLGRLSANVHSVSAFTVAFADARTVSRRLVSIADRPKIGCFTTFRRNSPKCSEFIDDAITSRISFATVAFFLRETKTRGFSQPH